MSLDVRQVRDFVVRPTLALLGLPGGLVAEQLVLGTAAQESQLVYIDQLEPPGRPQFPGPALGLWQMERLTFTDMYYRFLKLPGHVQLLEKVNRLLAPAPAAFEQLCGNAYLACALCRIRYYERPFRIAEEEASVEQLAAWWKQWYNTAAGDGTPDQFIASYRRLVAPVYAGAR